MKFTVKLIKFRWKRLGKHGFQYHNQVSFVVLDWCLIWWSELQWNQSGSQQLISPAVDGDSRSQILYQLHYSRNSRNVTKEF